MDFGRNGRPLPGFRPASAACGKKSSLRRHRGLRNRRSFKSQADCNRFKDLRKEVLQEIRKLNSFNFVFSKGKISFCRNNGGKRNFCSKCAHWNCNKKSNRCFRNCSANSNRRFRKNCRHVLKIWNALLLRFNRNESQGEIFRTKLIEPAYTFWHREFQKQIYCRRKKQYNIYNRCDFRQNTCSVSGKFADHFHF